MTVKERVWKMKKAVALITELHGILLDLDDEEEDRPYDESLDIFYSAVRQTRIQLLKNQHLMCVALRDYESMN